MKIFIIALTIVLTSIGAAAQAINITNNNPEQILTGGIGPIAQSNVKVLGDAPAQGMSVIYQTLQNSDLITP